MKDTIHQFILKLNTNIAVFTFPVISAHKVRVKDRKEICDDFKAVYQASSKEEANTLLRRMIENGRKLS
jgi:putative transposase